MEFLEKNKQGLENEIRKRKSYPEPKKCGTLLLNWYNILLLNYFNRSEEISNVNRGIINRFSNTVEELYGIDSLLFMEHIVLNWKQYHTYLNDIKTYTYPALKLIYRYIGDFMDIYIRLYQKNKRSIEKW